MKTGPIQMELAPVVNGRTWHLFSVEYVTADGRFSTYIYALSEEHASHVVEELKATAILSGKIEGWTPA